jgi:hypothetical protein
MKLRAIEVRNWGCIGSLRLADLPDGVVVLRGGNRTGKSSLVQAIRSCLFEHDHESKDSALTAFIPWHSKATPHVTVELELAGEHYRLSKTFAKTREGQASLEKRAGAGWSTLARGKEASKLARDLLGVEKSEAGIFQILWLGQRDFHLPAPDKIDPTLREALEAVLGTLITGRDLVLKDRLDQACANWFTDKKMDYRKDSPVTRLAGKLQEEKQRLAQIQEQWNGAQSALERYEDASERHPELQRQREEAEAELQRVQKDCEAARQRLALRNASVCSGRPNRTCEHSTKARVNWNRRPSCLKSCGSNCAAPRTAARRRSWLQLPRDKQPRTPNKRSPIISRGGRRSRIGSA